MPPPDPRQRSLAAALLAHQIDQLQQQLDRQALGRPPSKQQPPPPSSSLPAELRHAAIVVLDASALLFALPVVKRLLALPLRPAGGEAGAPAVVIPPEVLRTLDVLKKGATPLAQAVRRTTRFLEHALAAGSPPRLTVAPASAAVPALPEALAAQGEGPVGEAWLRNELATALHYLSLPAAPGAGNPVLLVSSPADLAAASEPDAARATGDDVRDALVRCGRGDCVFWVAPEAAAGGGGATEGKEGHGQEARAGAKKDPQSQQQQQQRQPVPVLLKRPPAPLAATDAPPTPAASAPSRRPAATDPAPVSAGPHAAGPRSSGGSKLVLLQRPKHPAGDAAGRRTAGPPAPEPSKATLSRAASAGAAPGPKPGAVTLLQRPPSATPPPPPTAPPPPAPAATDITILRNPSRTADPAPATPKAAGGARGDGPRKGRKGSQPRPKAHAGAGGNAALPRADARPNVQILQRPPA